MDSRKLLITDMPYRGRKIRLSCLTCGFKIFEVRCETESEDTECMPGAIYIGRVQKVLKNIDAAFVDISPSISCYLPLNKNDIPLTLDAISKDICSNAKEKGGGKESTRKDPSEDKIDGPRRKKRKTAAIKAGDEVLVQVKREALKSKEPSVSGRLELTGRYCAVMLGEGKTGVSSKLSKEQNIKYHFLAGGRVKPWFDVIVRTNAALVPDDELLNEIDLLCAKLEGIIKNAPNRVGYTCLLRPDPQYVSMIGSQRSGDIDEIVTDIPEVCEKIISGNTGYSDMAKIPVRLYEDPMLPLYKLYSIEKQLDDALASKVWLKSGGYIVIERTEALTAIDVNTGKSVSKKGSEEHFFKTNMEAAAQIAFQLRLRNISGIILVDLINMEDEEHIERVISAFKDAVRSDPVRVTVHEMTKLGLLEITRKKVRKSLAEQLT